MSGPQWTYTFTIPVHTTEPWRPAVGDKVEWKGCEVVEVCDAPDLVYVRSEGRPGSVFQARLSDLSPYSPTQKVKWWRSLGRALPDGRRICAVYMEDDDRLLFVNVHGTDDLPDGTSVHVELDESGRIEVQAEV
jgi:hypothetical protein